MKNLFYAVIIFILPFSVKAETGKRTSLPTHETFIIAQNTAKKEEDAEKIKNSTEITPLPPAKYSITSEKPVKFIPGEEKPGQEDTVQSSPAQNPSDTLMESTQTTTDRTEGTKASLPVASSPVLPTSPTIVPADSGAATTGEMKKQEIPSVTTRESPVKEKKSTKLMEELSIVNVPTSNFRTMKFVIDDQYNLRGMVYGEEQGYIRILEADDNDNFREVWKSPPCNSPIRGLFVHDLYGDGQTQIVAYTANGNFYIYDYQKHNLIYKTPEGTYQNINCMIIANMDSDPQMELFFIGVKPGTGSAARDAPTGNLVQFDPKTLFEEWTSSDLYSATDILIGNVDNDPEPEIILNTGEILSLRFKDVEWKSTIDFGSRIYLIDMDSDGILELVTEYGESYIKIIDVDQRQEKW